MNTAVSEGGIFINLLGIMSRTASLFSIFLKGLRATPTPGILELERFISGRQIKLGIFFSNGNILG